MFNINFSSRCGVLFSPIIKIHFEVDQCQSSTAIFLKLVFLYSMVQKHKQQNSAGIFMFLIGVGLSKHQEWVIRWRLALVMTFCLDEENRTH